jgi:predicted lipoprotein with Yx(FWY)xxD motif
VGAFNLVGAEVDRSAVRRNGEVRVASAMGEVAADGGEAWFAVTPTATTVPGPAVGAAPTTAAATPTTAAAAPATTGYGKAAVVPSTVAPAAPAASVSPIVGVADNALGSIVVDSKGRTLYAFTKDVDGTSTCADGCAKAWPAVVVKGDIVVGNRLDKGQFSSVARADGTKQLKLGKWPLYYYFSGDAAAGETNGQGAGGSWFVIGKDAKLIKGS